MLSVTPAHAFRLVSSPLERSGEEIWRAAGQLQAGDHVRSINGIVRLDSTYTEAVSPTPVISYELEGGLDYVVGEMPVVVGGTCNLRTIISKLGNEYDGFKTWFKANKNVISSSERSRIIQEITDKLTSTQLNAKKILKTETDAQGRLVIQYERGDNTFGVVSAHLDKNGKYIVTEYKPTYRADANLNYDVDISANRLVPDFSTKGGTYLHPDNKGRVIRIEMKGTRDGDFSEALKELRKQMGDNSFSKPSNYTWHHMDDFEYINGKAYCTMQLVETTAHSAKGMAHSGSVAQHKAFGLGGY